jgi:hypothetical protein
MIDRIALDETSWVECVTGLPKQARPVGPRISVNFSSSIQAT